MSSPSVLDEIAETEVSGASKLRMLSAALTAANTLALIAILLYLADLYTATEALELGLAAILILFTMHLVVSRLPAMARAAQQYTVKRPDSQLVDVFVATTLVGTVIIATVTLYLGPEKMARVASAVGDHSAYLVLLGGILLFLAMLKKEVNDG